MGKPIALIISKIVFLFSFFLFVCTVTLLIVNGRDKSRPASRGELVPTNINANSSLSPNPYPLKPALYTTTIHTVSDGDTVYTTDFKAGIRLIGINAPEVAGYTSANDQCGALESTEKLKSLVLGKQVVLVEDRLDKIDAYGRLLRYVYICNENKNGQTWKSVPTTNKTVGDDFYVVPNDCQDINLEMVASGFAEENAYRKHFEKEKEYVEAEKEAKENKLGNWKMCE